ncbi:bacterial regulatory helix-turn-helix, lysR family protein [Paraburkholderia xenovorans LB400]|uniref:Transcriptional regulator, LysR family n=1 Tax=Paraburkholderia xenovorans (strain LB400) TaxID=266265 RepID=Q13PB2_PARXL|nr:LysR family transcriptional regulator [Paraburkholderia xenovorans]ABE34077.1 transcriptional regulator, LysR family [Paraburkholderia xenovorans LB400]AIP35434.1 bacterial regulatory helix-turn-helix, lysR family protein [Paraburkholderia xenovorans LB400]
MEIRQLQTFLRIVETGSFAAAAEALHATQSTVSARIRELERSLGVALFDRSQHRAQLTAKGSELVTLARQMVLLGAQIRERIGASDALVGTLRLGVVGLVAATWLPALISAMRARYPRVSIAIEVALTNTLIERVRNGEMEVAIVTGPLHEPAFEHVHLGHDAFAWMAAPSLVTPLPREPLQAADLLRWPILGLSAASHHYPVIERWFRDAHVAYRPVISCSTVRVLADLTIAGLGTSLLPVNAYAADVAAGRLQVIATEPNPEGVEFVALHRPPPADPLASALTGLASELAETGVLRGASPAG